MSPDPDDAVLAGIFNPKQTPSEGHMLATWAEAWCAISGQSHVQRRLGDFSPSANNPRTEVRVMRFISAVCLSLKRCDVVELKGLPFAI
jgi:hypothetical protein